MGTYAAMMGCPRRTVWVDGQQVLGSYEPWRLAVGLGGINSHPLPARVAEGIRALHPRQVRVFIQEFFRIYPRRGRPDWSRLDPYMDSLAATGAKVVACIAIKPAALFPTVDAAVWRPGDAGEWQGLVAALVRRYSVDRPLVTHWEIGNEPDIGEQGGCPFLIRDGRDYGEFYELTSRPIRESFPQAKVGGPALAGFNETYLRAWLDHCRRKGLPVDFLSWHLYSDDRAAHAGLVARGRRLLEEYPGLAAELYVTEWSKGFDPVSVEELAFHPRRAALVAGAALAYLDSGADSTHYYHVWDQTAYAGEFRPFFADPRIMTTHWNQVPHRFGLFGQGQEVRPQYFVFQMLGRLGRERLAAGSDEPALGVLAAREAGALSAMLINCDAQESRPLVASVVFRGISAGRKVLTTWRIDERRRWDEERLELLPLERREVEVSAGDRVQVFLPGDSVLLARLEDVADSPGEPA